MIASIYSALMTNDGAAKTTLKDKDVASAYCTTSPFYTRICRTVILQAACDQIRRPSNSCRVPCRYKLVVSVYKTSERSFL